VAGRRKALVDAIREASQSGQIRPGEMVPTVRELSTTYELSPQTVSLELRKLVDEGLLYTVPRVGVFLSRQVPAVSEPFLLVTPPAVSATGVPSHTLRLRIGFEERAAQLGVTSVAMPIDVALTARHAGALPELAGVFDASVEPEESKWAPADGVPCVRYSAALPDDRPGSIDRVYFDDFNGGRIATDHLVQQGHTVVAFLGLHRIGERRRSYEWSVRRADGWAERLTEIGVDPKGLLYTPRSSPRDFDAEVASATAAARSLVKRDDVTAVVGANDHAVLGLFNQLRLAAVPRSRWPAVVGFDGTLDPKSQMVTSIRLPWEQLGRAAADLLWDRRTGRLTGPSQSRQIGMTLIPRLSSTKTWSSGASEDIFTSIQG
jgi:DNA-binding LacI/PurR family transcriptional regulator